MKNWSISECGTKCWWKQNIDDLQATLKTHNNIQFASDKWDKHKKAGKRNHSKLCMCSWYSVKALMFVRGSKMKDSFIKIQD